MLLRFCLLCGAAALLSNPASCGVVEVGYHVSNLGGNQYQYSYSVSNNGSLPSGSPVQLFDILFDPLLYQNGSLNIVTPDQPKSDWSEELLTAIAPGLPMDYDALALNGGIAAGSSVSGFAVQFRWIGQGLPGSQPFQIYSPIDFSLLQSGETTTTTPEPSFFWMIGIVLGYWAFRSKGYRASRLLPEKG